MRRGAILARVSLCFEHVDMVTSFYRVRVSNLRAGRALGGQVPRRLQHATGLHQLHELLHEGDARALQEVLSRQDSCSKTGDVVKLYWVQVWFKLIYLRSVAKHVIPTYINHSRPLIPDSIHLFLLNEVWEEPVVCCITLFPLLPCSVSSVHLKRILFHLFPFV